MRAHLHFTARSRRGTAPTIHTRLQMLLSRGLIGVLLLLPAAAASAQVFAPQPQTLRDITMHRELRATPTIDWPMPDTATGETVRLAWSAAQKQTAARGNRRDHAGWQFSMSVHQPDPALARSPATAARLPLLGDGVAQAGNVLKSGLYRSFGPWIVRLDLKQQHSAQYGSFRKPAISLLYRRPGNGALAGFSLTRASRSPGFYATGHPVVGNAADRSERSQQAELFFVTGNDMPWRAKLTLFQAYYRDMMDFDAGPPPSLVDRARVYMRGVEASVSRRWQSGARVYLHAANIAWWDPESGLDLRYRPRQQATGGVAMRLSERVHAHASLTWFGPRFDAAGSTPRLGGHTEAGLMLSWKARNSQAFVALDNLFDRTAPELPEGWASGRRLRLGWQMPF